MRLKLTDILFYSLAILPWSIYAGRTKVDNILLEVTTVQFWLFRVTAVNRGGEQTTSIKLLAGGGDPYYQFLHFLIALALLWKLSRHLIKKLTSGGEYKLKMRSSTADDVKDESTKENKEIGNVFNFLRERVWDIVKLVLLLYGLYVTFQFTAWLSLRDIHGTSYEVLNRSWGNLPKGSELQFVFPLGALILLAMLFLNYREDPFQFATSVINDIRFTVIGLFVIISIFPLIWVVIVSLNTQTVIRSGTALWPLDPRKELNFDSYRRFFIFEGDTISLVYLIAAIVLGGLAYHQVNHPGAWEDKIQAFFDRFGSKALASNTATSLMFVMLLILEVVGAVIAMTLIVSTKPLWGLPPGNFSWVIIDSTGNIKHIGNWFIITTIICTGVSLFGLIMACLSAYSLSRFDFPAKTGFISVVLGTQMFPGIILLLPLLVMWNQLELTNSIFGLTLAYATFAVPFSTFMMKGYFDSIPKDLEEAAMVDGTTQLGAFTKVILPISLPGLASTFLFSFLTGYTEYLLALTLYGAPEKEYTISLALINVFRTDFQNYYYPDMALFSIIVALPILLMFVYLQKFLISGLATGGIKG